MNMYDKSYQCVPVCRNQVAQRVVVTVRTSAEFVTVTTVTMATVANVTRRASTLRLIMTPVVCKL